MPMLANDSIRTHVLWDSITLGAADVTATLFQIPRGQGGKTDYETNMVQAGQVPKGKSFEILAIGWNVEADATLATLIALSKGYWKLVVSDKTWAEADLFFTPGGSGLWGPGSGAAASELLNVGLPDARNLWSLEYAITLSDNESFYVDLQWPVAPTAIKFWFMLYGREKRSLN